MRSIMIATMALFIGSGVYLIATRDGTGRAVGIACLLFFGFGGATYLLMGRRRAEGAVQVVEHRRDGASRKAVVVPVRPWKWRVTAVGALGFGVGALMIGIVSMLSPDAGTSLSEVPRVTWAGGALLLMMVAGVLTTARAGPPRLALLPDGVLMTVGLGRSFVPWEAVVEVGAFGMEAGPISPRFAGVRVTDPSQIETPRWLRWWWVLNLGVSGWDVAYQEAPFDLEAEEIAELVARLAEPDREDVLASLPPGDYSFDGLVAHLEGERPAG